MRRDPFAKLVEHRLETCRLRWCGGWPARCPKEQRPQCVVLDGRAHRSLERVVVEVVERRLPGRGASLPERIPGRRRVPDSDQLRLGMPRESIENVVGIGHRSMVPAAIIGP